MMTEVNSDKDFRRYRETVGIETVEALAAQGFERDTAKSDDSRGMYIKGLSEFEKIRRWFFGGIISKKTARKMLPPPPTQTVVRQQRRSPR